jgi:hypothetical protein
LRIEAESEGMRMSTRFENAIVVTLGPKNAVLSDSAVVVEARR